MFSLQHHFPRSSLTCFNRPSGQRPHYTLKRAKRVARATGVAGVTHFGPKTCNAGASPTSLGDGRSNNSNSFYNFS